MLKEKLKINNNLERIADHCVNIEQDKIVDEKLRGLTNEVIDTMDNCHTMSKNAISALLIGRDLSHF
jgi:phosphate uptake regulator